MVGSTIGFDTSGLKMKQSSKQEFYLHRMMLGQGIRTTLHSTSPRDGLSSVGGGLTKFIKGSEKSKKKKSK